ncbi:MAG: GNAT family N-acetyltransferase [Bacteroidia bacterium]
MEIKDYAAGDEVEILKLFQLAFGKKMPLDYWKWRFLDNPENKVMIKLMWDNTVLAGHYAVSPVKLNVNGKLVLSALSMTTMTHPDYAGRGIFTELAEKLYDSEAIKNDLKVVWGFPNNNSHYAFVKNLKWNNLEQIPTFSININKVKETQPSLVKVCKAFKKEHIEAQYKTLKNYAVKVEKTIDYLTWRYLKNPTNSYVVFELLENDVLYYAVTKVFPSFEIKDTFEIDIVELVFPADLNSIQQLLQAIKNNYKEYKLLKINCWLPYNDDKHLLFEKIGFVNIAPITYSGIRILDNNYKSLQDATEWYYSMGDSDIY